MLIRTEEKKRALCAFGTVCASCRVLYPVFDGKENISAFYESVSDNLLGFFESEAEKYREEYASLPRNKKRSFSPLRMNTFFTVTYADGNTVSIVREYILCREKELLFYKRSAEVWDVSEEALVHPKKLFPRKAVKLARENEFFYDGSPVVIENLFPSVKEDTGRRRTLDSYVRLTRF